MFFVVGVVCVGRGGGGNGKQHKIHGNELILFETAKTNSAMMAKSF